MLDQKVDSIEFIERAATVAKDFNQLSKEHKLRIKDWLDNIIEEPVRHFVLTLMEKDREEVELMTANITRTLIEEREQAILTGKLEVAKRMLEKGISLEDIIDMTGIDEEILKEVSQK